MAHRKIIISPSFERAYKKFTKGNSVLKKMIDKSLIEIEQDVFSQKLKTHKLSGNLFGMFACSCGYDCRIIFSIEKIKNTEQILLIDIGTHEDVY